VCEEEEEEEEEEEFIVRKGRSVLVRFCLLVVYVA
jgi:hypothetical protein